MGRHTWQSWRERYKKHYNRLDKHIAAIVSVNQASIPPQPESQYGLFKLSSPENSNSRKRRRITDEKKADEPSESVPPASTSSAVQDSQEDDWAIRVGSDPVPEWAKQLSNEGLPTERTNTPDANAATLRTFVLTPANQGGPRASSSFGAGPEFAQDFNMHNPLIDQELQAIATEFQFYAEEVRAYYGRTQNLAATRERFERFRAIINQTP